MVDQLKTALSHLEKGDWEAAHVIVQEDESALASWMHAIVHLQEGDTGNATIGFGAPSKRPSVLRRSVLNSLK